MAPVLVTSITADEGTFERLTTREVTVPAGTQLPIILDSAVASNTSRAEQPVRAHLSRDVRLGNEVVIPAGSELRECHRSSPSRQGQGTLVHRCAIHHARAEWQR